MKFELITTEKSTTFPCLMKNETGLVALVTADLTNGNKYVTIVSSPVSADSNVGKTWVSDLEYWEPMEKGIKVIFEN